MKWFKNDCDMHTNLKIQELIEREGAEGYAIWILCLEMVGKEGKKGKIDGQKRWQKGLEKVFQWSGNGKVGKILNTLAEIKLINPKSLNYGNLHIPEFTKRGDDYFRRQLRTKSEQPTEKVPLEEIRRIIDYIIDKKRIDIDKNPHLITFSYKRYGRVAKELALISDFNFDVAKQAIDWVAEWCEKKGYSWELETVVKHFLAGKQCDFKINKGIKYS